VQQLQANDMDYHRPVRIAESLEKIGTGNEIAIAALVEWLQSNDMHDCTVKIAETLGKIGTGNENAIAALVSLLQSKDLDNFTRKHIIESLGKIGAGNKNVITAFVQLLLSNNVDEDTPHRASRNLEVEIQVEQSLIKVLRNIKHRFAVVKALGGYDCYSVFWECAQNMPYPNFYQAWYHSKQAQRRLTVFLLSSLLYYCLAPALNPLLGMIWPNLERIFNGSNHQFIPHLCDTNESDKHLCDGVISSPNK
jgi:hypothetical protein